MTPQTQLAPLESDRTDSVAHPSSVPCGVGRPRCALGVAALLWAAACLPSLDAQIYVANAGNNTVTAYGLTAFGNASPGSTISGSSTGLTAPLCIAADANNLYVTNDGAGAGIITIYGRSSNGNLAPVRSISGSVTGLDAPNGIAVDANSIYVINNDVSQSVTIYPLGASGNAPPTATISGGSTGLTPACIAVDASSLYVTNDSTVTVYALSGVTSGTLNLAPSATITAAGSLPGALVPTGIAVDSSHIYVANQDSVNGGSILVYALGANGPATPIATINGLGTGLNNPFGIAVDATTIYVTNDVGGGNDSVTTYALSGVTSGTLNLAPTTTISGAGTGLNTPLGLAVATPIAAPVLTASGGSTAFTEGDDVPSMPVMVDSELTVSSSESSLASGTVAITGNFQPTEDMLGFVNPGPGPFGNISGSYNPATGVLTLTSVGATATPTQWQAAFDSVLYGDSAIIPNTLSRTVSFTVNDGVQNSNTVTKTVTVTAVDQTPVVLTTGGSSSFTGSAVAVDAGVLVGDLAHPTLPSGTVAITGAFQTSGDVLAFTNTSAATFGDISASYNASSGVLSLTSPSGTATLAQWQAALQAVTYTDTASSPSTAARTVSFTVNDGITTSAPATKSVTVQGLNATTTTAAAVSAISSSADQTVSLSAAVTSGSGTVNAGTVTFTLLNGSTPVGSPVTSGTVTAGTATASYTLPAGTAVGSYTIQAVYNAGGSFATSTTSGTSLSVSSDATTTTASGTFSVTQTVSTFASGFNNPAGLAFDAAGNLYVANAAGGTISKVTPTGAVSTFVASGLNSPRGLAFDAAGNLYVANAAGGTISKVTSAGAVSTFASGLGEPLGLAFDAAGNLYVADLANNTVKEVTSAGGVSTFVASGLNFPQGLAFDAAGNLYVANSGGNTISKVTSAGAVTTFASGFTEPVGLAFDTAGNLYVANNDGNTVSKVTPAGVVTTFASGFSLPSYLVFDAAGNLYVANYVGNTVDKLANANVATLTATVVSTAGTVNAGTVTFTLLNGSTVVGSAVTSGTVAAGNATVAYPLPANIMAGSYTIQAVYNAGGTFATSSDSTHSLSIPASATTVAAAAASATSSPADQTVSLSAAVTSSGGTVNEGTFTFTILNGTTQVGTAVTSGTVTAGTATASYTLPGGTAAGSYTIQAVYNAGGLFATSTDSTQLLTVLMLSPTTVAASATPVSFDSTSQTVSLSAKVTSAAGTVNAGTVTFTLKNGSTVVGSPVTSGTVTAGAATAIYTLPAGTAGGTYTIQAVYNSGGIFATSSDSTHSLTVAASTPTTVAASAPSVTFDSTAQTVSLSATVTSASGPVNAGTVTFTLENGTTPVGTAVTSGTVTNGSASASYFLPAGTAPGSYTILVAYNGGGSFAASSASGTTLSVELIPTTTSASGTFSYNTKVSTFASGFDGPDGLIFDAAGNLYVSNYNGTTVSKVTAGGATSIFASGFKEPDGLAFDSAGNLYVSNFGENTISKVVPDGTVTPFTSGYNGPNAFTFDAAGNLYVVNYHGGTISKMTPGGTVSTFASGFNEPFGLAFDQQGNLYVSDVVADTVSKVTPGGAISTFASGFNEPVGLAFDSSGNLYVACHQDNTISMVTPAGSVSTFVSGLSGPNGLAFDKAGNLYVSNNSNDTVSKITTAGLVTLKATVTSSAGTVNAGTVTFTLTNGSTVVGTPVTSSTVVNGAATVTYPLPFGTEVSTYTINAVYNPGGSYGGSSDSSHSLTPTVLQALQIFFGGFGTSGASVGSGLQARTASASSSLAAILNPDGTTGELVGYIASINSGFVVDITVNADNTFSGQTQALTSTTGTGQTLTFSGSIANGVMTGTIAELSLPFSATVDPAAGSSAAVAGLYQATGSGGAAYTIVGTQGEVFELALTPSGVAAGTGTIAADNSFTVSTAQGVSVSGTVDAATTGTTATITLPNGGGTIGVSGVASTTSAISQLANFSTLQEVAGGTIISEGFVVTGSGPKQFLVRAVGPGLSAFGVSGVLATPTLTLLDASRNTVVTNSGWAGDPTLAAAFSQVGAFSLATDSLDAAAVAVLQPGTYYLQVTGGGNSGKALAEIYDLDPISSQPLATLVNESSIGAVAGTSTILIGGFVIEGNSPQTVLIRGIGPGLSQFGVPGVLAAPSLSVFDGKQTLIAQNQAWGAPISVSGGQLPATASAIAAAASSAGAFTLASGSNDTSVLVTLPPGPYTAQLSGVGGTSGIGLVEIYVVP